MFFRLLWMQKLFALYLVVLWLLFSLLELIFPASCLLCSRRLSLPRLSVYIDAHRNPSRQSPSMLHPHTPVCHLCEESLLEYPHTLSESHDPSHDPSRHAAYLYGGTIKDLVRLAKFDHDETAARTLAAYAAQQIDEVIPHLPCALHDLICITFVPTSWQKRCKRGFDLPALLARSVGKHLRIPVYPCLVATRYDAALALTQNKEERIEKVRGRFQILPRARKRFLQDARLHENIQKHIHRPTVLLIDDVITTGATLKEAAHILENAGFHVVTFALASTPLYH